MRLPDRQTPDKVIPIYADDSAILFVHKDVDFISVKLGKVLEKCSDWLIDNRLSLHLGKTECMLFGPYQMLRYGHQIHRSCQIFGCTN